jgi:hypothetical protein
VLCVEVAGEVPLACFGQLVTAEASLRHEFGVLQERETIVNVPLSDLLEDFVSYCWL